jgi:hypothetical protein
MTESQWMSKERQFQQSMMSTETRAYMNPNNEYFQQKEIQMTGNVNMPSMPQYQKD